MARGRRGLPAAVAGPQAGPAQRSLRPLAEGRACRPAKKAVGQRFKVLKELVESLLERRSARVPPMPRSSAEAIDITLPGTRRLTGAEHPITRTLNEIVSRLRGARLLGRRWARG